MDVVKDCIQEVFPSIVTAKLTYAMSQGWSGRLLYGEWHQQAGSISSEMQTSQLLQPDYTKHRRTIWQCRPVTF